MSQQCRQVRKCGRVVQVQVQHAVAGLLQFAGEGFHGREKRGELLDVVARIGGLLAQLGDEVQGVRVGFGKPVVQ